MAAVRKPLDPPVSGVRRARVDAGEGQRGRVHPGAVPVAVGEEGWPVGQDGVECARERRTAGKTRHTHPPPTIHSSSGCSAA